MQSSIDRPVFRLGASLLMAGSLIFVAGPGRCAPSQGAGGDEPVSLPKILAAWSDSTRAWAHLPQEARRSHRDDFLRSISLSDLKHLCRTTSDGDSLSRQLEHLMRARLTLTPLTVAQLADLMADPAAKTPCHKSIVQFLSHTKDQYSPEEGALLGGALLKIADRGGYETGVRNQIESAAAHLSTADSVLQRIRAYSESQSTELRALAFDMMAESKDPRAADLMLAALTGYLGRRTIPPGRALIASGTKLGPRAFDPLMQFLSLAPDSKQRRVALEAVASTNDPRAFPVILEEYGGTEAGIRDRTSEILDRAEKDRYYDLYHYSRILEPAMMATLATGSPDLRQVVIEILDRESRYGPCANFENLTRLLQEPAGDKRPDDPAAQRCKEIAARFTDWERIRTQREQRPYSVLPADPSTGPR